MFPTLFRKLAATHKRKTERPAHKACFSARLGVEALEAREMLASRVTPDLIAGVLQVKGTEQADKIYLYQSDSTGRIYIGSSPGGTDIGSFPRSHVTSIEVYGYGGADLIALDGSNASNPIRVNSFVDGGSGNDTIYGGDATDWLFGGAHDDSLYGRSGDDYLFGEADRNTLLGEQGVNYLDPGNLPRAVGLKWMQLGGRPGALGDKNPIGGGDGSVEAYEFTNGTVYYWGSSNKAYAVYGAIKAKYAASANLKDVAGRSVQSLLGTPVSDELPAANGGRVSHFQGGSIYWSAATGTHVIGDRLVLRRYTDLKGAGGALGLPTSGGVEVGSGWWKQEFQKGVIYSNGSQALFLGEPGVQGKPSSSWIQAVENALRKGAADVLHAVDVNNTFLLQYHDKLVSGGRVDLKQTKFGMEVNKFFQRWFTFGNQGTSSVNEFYVQGRNFETRLVTTQRVRHQWQPGIAINFTVRFDLTVNVRQLLLSMLKAAVTENPMSLGDILGSGTLRIYVGLDDKSLIKAFDSDVIRRPVQAYETYELIMDVKGHADRVLAASFAPGGKRLVTGSFDGVLKIWDLDKGKELKSFKGHDGWVSRVSITPNGKFLVSAGSDGAVKLWELATGRQLGSLKGYINTTVELFPDGKALALTDEDKIRIWDIRGLVEQ